MSTMWYPFQCFFLFRTYPLFLLRTVHSDVISYPGNHGISLNVSIDKFISDSPREESHDFRLVNVRCTTPPFYVMRWRAPPCTSEILGDCEPLGEPHWRIIPEHIRLALGPQVTVEVGTTEVLPNVNSPLGLTQARSAVPMPRFLTRFCFVKALTSRALYPENSYCKSFLGNLILQNQ